MNRQFLDFSDALVVARALNINSAKEWKEWSKSGARPANIPYSPERTYVGK